MTRRVDVSRLIAAARAALGTLLEVVANDHTRDPLHDITRTYLGCYQFPKRYVRACLDEVRRESEAMACVETAHGTRCWP